MPHLHTETTSCTPKMDKRILHLQGPDFQFFPSTMDLTSPVVSSQRTLIFRLPPHQSRTQAADVLQAGLQALISEIPFLAGNEVWDLAAIEKHGQKSRRTITKGSAVLTIQDVSPALSYDKLEATKFSQHLLDYKLLCSAPLVALPPLPVTELQANFGDGVLLLVICIRHIVADGIGLTNILRRLAHHCRNEQTGNGLGQAVQETSTGLVDMGLVLDRSCLLEGLAQDWAPVPVKDYIRVDQLPKLPVNVWGTMPGPILSETFKVDASTMATLKNHASVLASPLSSLGSTPPYITTQDALSGLIWHCVMAARLAHNIITDSESVFFYIPIDFRSKMQAPISASYIGNAFYGSNAELPLSRLLSSDGIAAAAYAIRSAIASVDETKVRTVISMVQESPDIQSIGKAIGWQVHTVNIWSTSYRKFVHDRDWGSALGTLQAFRVPDRAFTDGCFVVLPDPGDGTWEFSLSLREEVMRSLKENELWRRFVGNVNMMDHTRAPDERR